MDIDKIEKCLEDAIKNGTEADVNYWRGYRDAVKAMMKNPGEISDGYHTFNEPLTLEELREMDGKPVWVEFEDGQTSGYGVLSAWTIFLPYGSYCTIGNSDFGVRWKVYRRPPKEGAP